MIITKSLLQVAAQHEEMIDDFLQVLLKELPAETTRTTQFTEAGLLMSAVLTRAFLSNSSPVEVTETLEKTPPFIIMPSAAEPLKEGERLTVAGEGVERQDLETLADDGWVNDKVTTCIW